MDILPKGPVAGDQGGRSEDKAGEVVSSWVSSVEEEAWVKYSYATRDFFTVSNWSRVCVNMAAFFWPHEVQLLLLIFLAN